MRYQTILFLVGLALAATSVFAQPERFVANLSRLQSVPVSNATRTLVCEAILERSPLPTLEFQLRIGGLGGSSFPQGTQIFFHKGAGVGETIAPFFGSRVGQAPGSWFVGITVSAADIELLRQNRWYFTVIAPDDPDNPIRGQVKLANGTYNDYDGDGRTDVQVYRTSNNTFYALRSTDGAFLQRQLGQPGDSVSLTVDWDRDGLSDFSTARYNAEVLWRIVPSTTGVLEETRWGSSSLGDPKK